MVRAGRTALENRRSPPGGVSELLELPPFPKGDSDATERRRVFAQTYILNRATIRDHGRIGFREDRAISFLDALAALFEAVIGEPVHRSERNLVLSTPATETVTGWDPPLVDVAEPPAP